MSAQPYANVTKIRPLTINHVRMAWVLKAKEAAHRALNAALAAPRKAAGYLARAVHKLHLDAVVSWLHRAASRLTRPVTRVASHLGTPGLLAAATGAVTSPTGRALLGAAGRVLGLFLGWVARKAYSGVDRVLRCFGQVGNTAADKLFAGIVSLGGKVATVATPVVHRAVLDSRVWAGVRSTVTQARTRAQRLHEQAQVLVDLERQRDGQLVFPDGGEDLPKVHVDEVHVVTTVEEMTVPSNRAERRAAQRQGKRSQ